MIRDAERRGWLVDIGSHGRGGRAYWAAQDVFDIVEAPPVYSSPMWNDSNG